MPAALLTQIIAVRHGFLYLLTGCTLCLLGMVAAQQLTLSHRGRLARGPAVGPVAPV